MKKVDNCDVLKGLKVPGHMKCQKMNAFIKSCEHANDEINQLIRSGSFDIQE